MSRCAFYQVVGLIKYRMAVIDYQIYRNNKKYRFKNGVHLKFRLKTFDKAAAKYYNSLCK